MIRYMNKCLLVEDGESNEIVLVIGDVHLGQGESFKIGGIAVGKKILEEIINQIEKTVNSIKSSYNVEMIDKIVLLGDLKHDFAYLSENESREINEFLDYLSEKTKEIVVIKGNHDNYLMNVSSKKAVKVHDYYIWKECCFLHGDKDFTEIHGKKIKTWLMGHLHPAINLWEGTKSERYKCFLEGEFEGKKIVILPSFSEINEGMDAREIEDNLVWKFNLKKFKARVVNEDGQIFNFGELGKIQE